MTTIPLTPADMERERVRFEAWLMTQSFDLYAPEVVGLRVWLASSEEKREMLEVIASFVHEFGDKAMSASVRKARTLLSKHSGEHK